MTKWKVKLPRVFGLGGQTLPDPPSRARQDQKKVIGVLVPNLTNSVFAECIEGMEQEARGAGYSLLVAFTNYDVDHEEGAIKSLIGHGVAGLLLTVADACASNSITYLSRQAFPYVMVFNQIDDTGRPSVSVDNTRASRELVDTLIEHGHRTIGMVVGSLRASDRSIRRLQGYRSALKEHGVETGPVVEIPFENISEELLAKQLNEIMRESDRPTALFCSNDMLALIIINGLRKLGFSVPNDISVVGFDGIALGQITHPPLAGIVQPCREMGATAVRSLVELITEKRVPASILLDHQLRTGGTLGRIERR
jgi:DNA-binding LacI/PurR family transcriptional regulator